MKGDERVVTANQVEAAANVEQDPAIGDRAMTTKLSAFQLFWAGINAERAARNLPDVLFGEARRMWDAAADIREAAGRGTDHLPVHFVDPAANGGMALPHFDPDAH